MNALFDDLFPRSVHSAAVAELASGDLVAVCYAFSFETSPDSTLELARFREGRWGASRTILDVPELAVGNPVLHLASEGTLHLYFALVLGDGWTDAVVMGMRSVDGGDTWSAPQRLHERRGLMTKTRPVATEDALLLPIYDEGTWCPMVLVAPGPDGPWRLHGDTTARGKAIQPAVAPLADDRLLMLSRGRDGRVYESLSHDGGRSWTASQPTDLANPNAGIDLLRRRDGTLLLVHNPDRRGRERLWVSASTDDGTSWRHVHTLADAPGEHAYPYALQCRDGTVHVLFTAQRTHVAHAILSHEASVTP